MPKAHSGYTPSMFRVLRRLKKLGLPETLFDADFADVEQQNREKHASLLERLRALENSEEWKDVELPWTAQRQEFEQEVREGQEQPFVATQPVVPVWKRSFELTISVWRDTHDRIVEREMRKKK